jgi:hypothetical protein
MKKRLWMLFFIILPCFLPAQQIEIAVGTGYGGCNMSGLQNFNEEIRNSLPFESEVVDDFPAWFIYRASVTTTIGNMISLGAIYTHSSTGSRVSSADYSGEYYFDTQLAANSLGFQLGFKVYHLNNLDVRVKAQVGMMFTNAGFRENLEVYGEYSLDDYSMNSLSLYLDPEIAVHYRFGLLGVAVFGGYRYNAAGHLRYDGQKTNLTTNWSGFNAGVELTIAISFGKGKRDGKKM